MKIRTLIAGAAASSGFLLFPMDVWAACPRVPDPNVFVQVIDPGPRVVSTESLEQINARAGSHGLLRQGFKVLGMTSINIESAINVQYKGMPVGKATCVSVAKVAMRFGLKDHTVHVPREYPRGGCHFNVVMSHEMAHVDINRKTTAKYAAILKNEVRSALRKVGAVAAESMVQGQNAQTMVIQQVIDSVKERFNAELKARQAVIDQPNGKYAANGKCPGW